MKKSFVEMLEVVLDEICMTQSKHFRSNKKLDNILKMTVT